MTHDGGARPDAGEGTADANALAAAVLAVLIVGAGALVPALADARVAGEIPVHESADADGSLADPSGNAWGSAEAVDVPLASAPSDVPGANDTTVETVEVRAARTDERLYVRLAWDDPTADRNVTAVRRFADAAAVQFPANPNESTAIAMGSTDAPVNVWYWNAGEPGRLDGAAYANATADSDGTNGSVDADGGAGADETAGASEARGAAADTTEELLAGGPGTTSAFEGSTVNATTEYANGGWTVVFSRPIDADGANRTAFDADRDVDVAVAVWNGSNTERSGQKSVSEWQFLALGPGPQGPPYESVLWGIAGLAIAVVVAVTATAVRRN